MESQETHQEPRNGPRVIPFATVSVSVYADMVQGTALV
jgi:hypothetical protein